MTTQKTEILLLTIILGMLLEMSLAGATFRDVSIDERGTYSVFFFFFFFPRPLF